MTRADPDALGGKRSSRVGVRRARAIALAAIAIGLGACVVNEPAAAPTGVAVSGPPPAPIAEAERPPRPAPLATWISGYWHWTGVHYTWIPGHWEQPPAGSTWRAPQYVTRDGAYFYQPGAWKRGEHEPERAQDHANAFR